MCLFCFYWFERRCWCPWFLERKDVTVAQMEVKVHIDYIATETWLDKEQPRYYFSVFHVLLIPLMSVYLIGLHFLRLLIIFLTLLGLWEGVFSPPLCFLEYNSETTKILFLKLCDFNSKYIGDLVKSNMKDRPFLVAMATTFSEGALLKIIQK